MRAFQRAGRTGTSNNAFRTERGRAIAEARVDALRERAMELMTASGGRSRQRENELTTARVLLNAATRWAEAASLTEKANEIMSLSFYLEDELSDNRNDSGQARGTGSSSSSSISRMRTSSSSGRSGMRTNSSTGRSGSNRSGSKSVSGVASARSKSRSGSTGRRRSTGTSRAPVLRRTAARRARSI